MIYLEQNQQQPDRAPIRSEATTGTAWGGSGSGSGIKDSGGRAGGGSSENDVTRVMGQREVEGWGMVEGVN